MRAASIVTTDAAEMHMTCRFSFRPLGETVSFQYISFQWTRLISCDCFHSSFQVPSTKSSCQSREGTGVRRRGGSYGGFGQAKPTSYITGFITDCIRAEIKICIKFFASQLWVLLFMCSFFGEVLNQKRIECHHHGEKRAVQDSFGSVR